MSGHVHVMPVGDLVEHDTTTDCPCGPRTEMVPRDDGSQGWLVTHASQDGREWDEPNTGGRTPTNGEDHSR